MKPEWASSREDPNTIYMSEDESEIVALYVQWLYYGSIKIDISKPDAANGEARVARGRTIYLELTKAYIFGEKIMDISFKNAVIGRFIKVHSSFSVIPGSNIVTNIYGATAAGSPLRRLITDMIACADPANQDGWATYIQLCPRETVNDAILAMATLRPVLNKRLSWLSVDKYLEKGE